MGQNYKIKYTKVQTLLKLFHVSTSTYFKWSLMFEVDFEYGTPHQTHHRLSDLVPQSASYLQVVAT